MMPDDIEVGHCYRLNGADGRRIIMHVLEISPRPVRVEDPDNPNVALTLDNHVVRFQWRIASGDSEWRPSLQELPLANFALSAETEVPCN